MENNMNNKENKNDQELHIKKANSNKFQKYFWSTIIALILGYAMLSLLAMNNQNEKISIENTNSNVSNKKESIILQYIDITSNKVKDNLTQNGKLILEDLNLRIKNINYSIDENLDNAFDEIINENIDNYLDFHYSLIGSYTELGTMVLNESEKLMEEKLFGPEFSNKMEIAKSRIIKESEENFKEHQKYITEVATEDIDLELNNKVLTEIRNDIESNKIMQEVKLGVVGAAIGAKAISLILAKMATKTALKIGAKVSTKVAGAGTGAATGAAAGLLCGPGAVICSPIAAIVGGTIAFFGTDVAINKVDEKLHREDLKKEILDSINEERQEIKNQYTSILNQRIEKLSNQTIDKYQEASIKERKIKDNL